MARAAAAAVLAGLSLSAFCRVDAGVNNLPAGFIDSTIVGSGLTGAACWNFAPDGHLFVGQQNGAILIVKNGVLLPTPFAQVPAKFDGEEGLKGLAFDPNFAVNGFLYLHYTYNVTSRPRVSRVTAMAGMDMMMPGSEVVLLDMVESYGSVIYHNTAYMAFGPDGKLYIAHGDVKGNTLTAQSLTSLYGKVLRINSDGTIPIDNPFYNATTGVFRAIWAMGFRNPFSGSFHPITGQLFVNDVGESSWEEVNRVVAGGNYGWPMAEGAAPPNPAPTIGNYSGPLYTYNHYGVVTPPSPQEGCCIVGSAFYAGLPIMTFPSSLWGHYFFSDLCSGALLHFDPSLPKPVPAVLGSGIDHCVGVLVDPSDGSLLYLTNMGNAAMPSIIGKVQYGTAVPATITMSPANQKVLVGAAATFVASGAGSPNLSYQWFVASADAPGVFTPIPGATGATYTTDALDISANGNQYRCTVTNALRTDTSAVASLAVLVGSLPVPVIDLPLNLSTYIGGTVINFAGHATDVDDGNLPASSLSWLVRFGHEDHHHPVIGPIPNTFTGTFTTPVIGEVDDVQWFEIQLTATNSVGMTSAVTVVLLPNITNISITASPNIGLSVGLDGPPTVTPYSRLGVGGMVHDVMAPPTQIVNGRVWHFKSWSDGKDATHVTDPLPVDGAAYTATYIQSILAVNFQPATAPVPAGFMQDRGAAYGTYANGTAYGWINVLPTVSYRRNSAISPDVRYDTSVVMPANAVWEAAVPSQGAYQVVVVVGDPTLTTAYANRNQDVIVEGISVIKAAIPADAATPYSHWLNATATVNVVDGRITIRRGSTAVQNWLCWVSITQLSPAASWTAMVNFQPLGYLAPDGYIIDRGLAYGARAGGNSFGWDVAITQVYRRGNAASPDLRYDTLAQLNTAALRQRKWEIAVPVPGSYNVLIVAGDPTAAAGNIDWMVEGVQGAKGTLAATPTTRRWISYSVTVPVTDGRLTITSGPTAQNNRICYLRVKQIP